MTCSSHPAWFYCARALSQGSILRPCLLPSGLEGTGVPAYRHLLFSRYRTGQFWGVPVREIACSRTFYFQLFWRVFCCFWYILSTQAVTVLGKLKANFFLLHVSSRPEAQLQVHHNAHSQYLYTGRGYLLQCIHRCMGVV
jgi:hypothetical protein